MRRLPLAVVVAVVLSACGGPADIDPDAIDAEVVAIAADLIPDDSSFGSAEGACQLLSDDALGGIAEDLGLDLDLDRDVVTLASGQPDQLTVSCLARGDEGRTELHLTLDQVDADTVEEIAEIFETREQVEVDPEVEADGLDPDSVFAEHDEQRGGLVGVGWVEDGVLASVELVADGERDLDRMLAVLSQFVPAAESIHHGG